MTQKVGKVLRVLSAGELIWIKALCHGVGVGTEHSSMLKHVRCRTVVDIGANRGQFALAVRRCFPTANIISFEPLPHPAMVFRRVLSGETRIRFHQAAIGFSSEVRTIHVSRCDDSSSLLPMSTLQTTIFPGTEEVRTLDVRVGPLEEFISAKDLVAPAILKLDVQGFEYEALMGCESLLQHFSYVYCECSFLELYSGQRLAREVVDWLSARGFGLAGLYNPYYDRQGRAIQADLLFSRDGKDQGGLQ